MGRAMDPTRSFTVRAADSQSAQGYTPFEGLTLTGQAQATFLRGHRAYEAGKILGSSLGQYLKRPSPAP